MTQIERNTLILSTIKEKYPLTQKGSTKETWHLRLDTGENEVEYLPGDSIAIYPQNDPLLVDHLIHALKATGDELITDKRSGDRMSLKHFFTHEANLSRLTSSFLKLIYECEQCGKIQELLAPENKSQLREYLTLHDPLDLIRDYAHIALPLQEICNQFGPLLPRFYSIASSQAQGLDLTVALTTYVQGKEKRYGVASHFLCHLAEIGRTPIPFYVQPAQHFRLPEDHSTNLIMIGPGTGIAPFRAFMQERLSCGATGKEWLFFGERNRKTDFFYEKEWEKYPNLRMETAFSRDQEEKEYVQHRLLENSEELFQWIEKGAYLYVCGDAMQMAKDVERALVEIIKKEGALQEDEAKAYLKGLKKSGRYLLDIY